ncbi:NAD-dependent protein deacetylase sirtuin-3, mitochondrial isoform X4 [Cuculus canorus]|uniref:NAD-dependent protein deacetylase sirtuin-3, mitochondrial isoform X4 n=1 Tax=Cuculus canorus TaxID=55661 RepID=UPI0023AB172A|nr:NAD-dependent protein deacetylase sirtuin-3, mitochondrial isoform X4 [Cuculus canorus]
MEEPVGARPQAQRLQWGPGDPSPALPLPCKQRRNGRLQSGEEPRIPVLLAVRYCQSCSGNGPVGRRWWEAKAFPAGCGRANSEEGVSPSGGDGWRRDQHAQRHPRFQVPGERPLQQPGAELYPGNYRPNYAHYFLRLLHEKGLLLRLYTQNIDGLERVAGIPPDKLVEAHGTFATATCTVCRRNFPGEEFRGDVMADKVPRCSVCTGLVKPDIVFFGEELPQRFLLHLTDFPMADLLFVIGTSLEVEPFASLAGAVRSSIPRVLINRDLVGPFAWQQRSNDVAQLGDVISSVEKLVELLGWTAEMETLIQKEKEKLDAKGQ